MTENALFKPPFRKLLVANRGEIAIRVLRAAAELKIRTVALYTYEDRYSLHRYKADESYQIGPDTEALKPYLDIEEIVELAKRVGVDAIHPGYGFLSENVDFAEACDRGGIRFIGPRPEVMQQLGDKISGKKIARSVGVPVIEDRNIEGLSIDEVARHSAALGYPVIVKAAGGGGGRGMRVVRGEENLAIEVEEAAREAERAFGDRTVFLEKFVENPKHVEVQLLGDEHGNLVHLFERDCSVQRRFQKVVEVAPSIGLPEGIKQRLYEYALAIGRKVNYSCVGTVEFLVDASQNIFFIEVNPRIQVEHTVTEEITGVDLVRAQILVCGGTRLADPEIAIPDQASLSINGCAIQCRITTEDPQDNFRPDTGRIAAYRSPGGFGIRLDAGSAYAGAMISPYFDSLLVKVTASGRGLKGAARRLGRALQEFRIRGVKTNIPFLINVITHDDFQAGRTTVRFIEDHPELFEFWMARDRGTKLLSYLAEVVVNGNPDVKRVDHEKEFFPPVVPEVKKHGPFPEGSRDRLKAMGREKFTEWLRTEKTIQYTDTTFRDAHQSLLATRVRTRDMLLVMESYARRHPEIFSFEVWGGATFDVSLRFLHECPWRRLRLLREAAPNVLFQMLLRGSNAVGYSAYPDNLIVEFIKEAASSGIDIFRIFDSMNWLPAMEVSIQTVREETDSLAEVCICYTGDILDSSRAKYSLQYYLDLAKRIEDAGAHILAIKDMAGLLKPYAARLLIERLREIVDLPIHLHTHDTAGVQAATLQQAVEIGVDVIDVALSSMSGLTSQPGFNSVVAMMEGHERALPMNSSSLNEFSQYWETVRAFYYPFECGLQAGTAEVYEHEIPGGQYSNLRPQARGLGLEEKFEEIKENYREVNLLLGDLVKVTPSSKVVGDLAMFMTSNGLTAEDVRSRATELSFPESLKAFFRGDLGQPYEGFPQELQKAVLKGEKPYTCRPNEHMEPLDLKGGFTAFREEHGEEYEYVDYLSSQLYPAVFRDYTAFRQEYGSLTWLPTPAFFYGLQPGEEILVDIDQGKTLMVRLVYVTDPNEEGVRTVVFKLNGQTRVVEANDRSVHVESRANRKAAGDWEVGAPLQGKLSEVLVQPGEAVEKGAPLFVIEAMKMESTVTATMAGTVAVIHLAAGAIVEQDDLVVELGSAE